jgi:glutamine---fructose-6-phosphate transaminase (isomerizing)
MGAKSFSAAAAPAFIQMPGDVPETLSPIAYVVAGQLFAYHLAVGKGHNPDAPRGLTKVTSTL